MTTHQFNQLVEFSSSANVEILDQENSITVERSQTWWNRAYSYRRVLRLDANTEGFNNGHPLAVNLSKDLLKQRKIRADYKDIEVLRLVSTVPETWQVLQRKVEPQLDSIKVIWPSEVDIPADVELTDLYYVYYGNSTLVNRPVQQITLTYDDPDYTYEFFGGLYSDDTLLTINEELTYEPEEWPVSHLWSDRGLDYTRPGEHWEGNLGVQDGAKVTLKFYGPKVRVIADKGPGYGIGEVQIDDADWVQVDLYNYLDVADQEVYSVSDLTDGYHVIRFKRNGFKNPAASEYTINFKRIDYLRHNELIDVKEESDESLLWGGSVGGTVGN